MKRYFKTKWIVWKNADFKQYPALESLFQSRTSDRSKEGLDIKSGGLSLYIQHLGNSGNHILTPGLKQILPFYFSFNFVYILQCLSTERCSSSI